MNKFVVSIEDLKLVSEVDKLTRHVTQSAERRTRSTESSAAHEKSARKEQ